jgi:glycosyltransferase involved in cell wall biosynthesis
MLQFSNLLLSIVTINKNNCSGLLKTIESVQNQGFKSFEHIIIDGNSEDQSVSEIQNYEKRKIASLNWISENDNGIYQAMNKGINMAKGKYLLFLNSGDELYDNSTLEKAFLMEPDSEVLYGDSIMFNNDGVSFYNKEPDELTLLRFIERSICHQSVFYLKSLFSKDRFGLYNQDNRIASDWEFNIKSIIFGNVSVKYLPFPISKVENGGISLTETERSLQEREKIIKALIPERIIKDYELLVTLRREQKRLRTNILYKIASKLNKIIYKYAFKFKK